MTAASQHALVIGKFYPPHAGHHALVRFAAQQAERVTVVVMAAAVETIPLADRVAWMTASHTVDSRVTVSGIACDAPVDLTSEPVWAAQVACMRAATTQVSDVPVDVVVSSEPYGEELARWFGARHIAFDPPRRSLPITGTDCRADLAAQWDHVDQPARAGLATRIVVLGSESTGTTTVAAALANHFCRRGGVWARTAVVDEFGRQDSLDKLAALHQTRPRAGADEVAWAAEDFVRIARTQNALEEAAARGGSPILICDTDAFATTVWERRYLGRESAKAAGECTDRRKLYLLTDHVGVPFVQDGIRDGEHLRADMTGWFVDALTSAGRSWVLLTGTLEDRVALAIRASEQELSRRLRFADPLAPA